MRTSRQPTNKLPYRNNYDNGSRYRKIMPVFEKSGLLNNNVVNAGVVLKYTPPPDAVIPSTYFENYHIKFNERPILKAKLYMRDSSSLIKEFNLDKKSHFLIGRARSESNNYSQDNITITDIKIPDRGCSKEHCVIQYREINKKLVPYIIDLDSVNGTSLNGIEIPSQRYVQLNNNDVITFSFNDSESDFELIYQEG